MKKLYTIVMVFVSALCLTALTNSCSDESKLIEELELANVLTPTSTSASISIYDGHTVTFTWASSSTATQYCLEIYRWASDSAPASASEITETYIDGLNPYMTITVDQGTGSSITYEQYLEEDYAYYARVKGQNPGNQGDSHWATFRYPIEPYLVMDPLPSFESIERTQNSITFEWTIEDGDDYGINQIRISPDPDDPVNSAYKAYSVTSGSTTATVDGLDPSTMYTASAAYGSTVRNTITAWTKSSAEGTHVTTSAQLTEAITGGQSPIIVDYTGETYVIDDEFTIGDTQNDELCIYGNGTGNGTNPTIYGKFALASGTSIKTIHLESLNMVGDNSNNVCVFSVVAGDYDEISMLNCNVSSYMRGIINAGSTTVNVGKFALESIYSEDIEGNGGGFIDFRGTAGTETIGEFSIKNSTFDGGIREFIRIDSNYTVGSFTADHNTFNAITSADNSYGIFYVRSEITGECTVTNNLFLNLAESYVHGASGRYVVGASAFTPTRSSGNYWYNLGDYEDGNVFPTSGETGWKQSAAFSAGGVLSSDPCYDSNRSNFYIVDASVITNSEGATAGDPRWLADYVQQPDPALEVVEYGYEWDLTDTKTFYDEIDETCTRGNLRFIIEETPIQVSSDGFYFTNTATLMSYSHAPSDCGIGFIVDGPGSVVLSTAEGNLTGLEVAYGEYDEGLVGISGLTTVAGNVAGGARKQSIVLDALKAGTIYMVYIYSLGPVYMTQLVWSDDTTTGGSGLTQPYDLTLSAESSKNTEDVTLSWAEIPNAATYNVNYVRYNGGDESTYPGVNKTDVTDTNSYTINGLEAGYYNFYVQAVPAESDSTRDPSDWSEEEVLFFSEGGELSNVSAYSDTNWGSSTFEYIYYAMANGTTDKFTLDFVYDNLHFIGGDTNSVLNDAVNDAGETVYAYSLGGSGSATKRALVFKVPGEGTLNMEIQSSGTNGTRYMKVFVDGVEYTEGEGYGSDADNHSGYEACNKDEGTNVHKIYIPSAQAGSEIMVYSAGSGINVLSLGWTPANAGDFPDTPEGCVPTYQVTEWASTAFEWIYENVANKSGDAVKDNDFTTQDELLTFVQGGGSGFKFAEGDLTSDTKGYRFQFGGSGSTTKCCVTFNVSTAGTLKFNIISGSADTTRYLNVTVGETEYKGETEGFTAEANSGKYPTEYSLSVDSVSGSTPIYLYSANSGINVFGIKWIPTGVTE